jgi:hypothetical protein
MWAGVSTKLPMVGTKLPFNSTWSCNPPGQDCPGSAASTSAGDSSTLPLAGTGTTTFALQENSHCAAVFSGLRHAHSDASKAAVKILDDMVKKIFN